MDGFSSGGTRIRSCAMSPNSAKSPPASPSNRAAFDAQTADGPERKLYGRRRSHKLRPGRAELMGERLRQLAVLPESGAPPDLKALFGVRQEIWLEIGFGGGEHLAHQAAAHSDVGMIGCEHYIDGVAKLLSAIDAQGLENVRVHPHDARDVMDALPDSCLSRVFLLYPDPWPKTRHHKRRFICEENLSALARLMRPGAELRVASDIPDYIRHSLQHALAHPAFDWMAQRSVDWLKPWADWPGTRYEEKALSEGRRPAYLTFRRRS